MMLAAGYLLFMYQRVVFGELSEFLADLGGRLTDITPIELLTLVPLATLIVVFGVQPGLLLTLVQGSVIEVLAAARGGRPSRSGRRSSVGRLSVSSSSLVLGRTMASRRPVAASPALPWSRAEARIELRRSRHDLRRSSPRC